MQQTKTYDEFIYQVSQCPGVQQLISRSESQYNLKKYKITEICVQNVLPIYYHIVQKFYKNHQIGDSATWVENELRLFIWTALCYLHLHQKTINQMNSEDWFFFSQVFYVKDRNLFEYQARTLFDEEVKVARWTEDEDYMLYQLIMRDRNAKWNQIAKSLYLTSNRRFLRPSKQCRQRWLNHLDPNKSKMGWTIRQILILFEHVEEKGKKWALLVRKLEEKRSEHTIKNKYNSIMKKQGKVSSGMSESQTRRQIISKLKSILENQTMNKDDELLLGISSKNKSNCFFERVSQFDNRFGPPSSKNDALKKKFEDFRKKIQKFSSFNSVPGKSPTENQEEKPRVTNKVSSLISKLNAPNFSLGVKPETHNQKEDESIFYEDSYEEIMVPLEMDNQAILAEEINNFINEDELQI